MGVLKDDELGNVKIVSSHLPLTIFSLWSFLLSLPFLKNILVEQQMPGIVRQGGGWGEKEDTGQAQFKSWGHVAMLFNLNYIMQKKTKIICKLANLLKMQQEAETELTRSRFKTCSLSSFEESKPHDPHPQA